MRRTARSRLTCEHMFSLILHACYIFLFFPIDERAALMLTTQFRMASEICEFPSKRFYSGRLRPAKCLTNQGEKWPLRHYIVMNLRSSEKKVSSGLVLFYSVLLSLRFIYCCYTHAYVQQVVCVLFVVCTYNVRNVLWNLSFLSRGLYNPIERDYVLELCKMILRETKITEPNIGIITPYRQQMSSIKTRLSQDKLNGIVVDTIDGYQGQEKEVIIISCVRGPNHKKTIGFLSHPQRMNVALTRAKKTLIILANCDSMEVLTDSGLGIKGNQ